MTSSFFPEIERDLFDIIKWNYPMSMSGVHIVNVFCDKIKDELHNEVCLYGLGRLHDDVNTVET